MEGMDCEEGWGGRKSCAGRKDYRRAYWGKKMRKSQKKKDHRRTCKAVVSRPKRVGSKKEEVERD